MNRPRDGAAFMPPTLATRDGRPEPWQGPRPAQPRPRPQRDPFGCLSAIGLILMAWIVVGLLVLAFVLAW